MDVVGKTCTGITFSTTICLDVSAINALLTRRTDANVTGRCLICLETCTVVLVTLYAHQRQMRSWVYLAMYVRHVSLFTDLPTSC